MRASRILLPCLLLTAALAGCSDGSGDQSVRSVYGDDASTLRELAPEGAEVPDEVADLLLIDGFHLEGRVGNGTWGPNMTAASSQTLDGPAMAAPEPSGGGGESTTLPNVDLTATVRIPEGDRLGGYRAAWSVGVPDASGNGSFDAVADPADEVQLAIGFGTTEVYAFLYEGEPEAGELPAAAYVHPVRFTVSAEFVITGEVQPVGPGGLPVTPPVSPPDVTPRTEMVDIYTMDVLAGTRVTASTAFNGAQGDGTDVDLGWYDPAGTGIQCTGSGGSGAPAPLVPDPSQAAESLEDVATSDGAWSIQVGAMQDGCSGIVDWYYNNAAAVPYQLTIHIG